MARGGAPKRPNSPGSRSGETWAKATRAVVDAGWQPLSSPRADSEHGAVAQLGARLNGIEEVRGSNPLSSTVVILALWLG